ncbi:MAG: murein L,D-transpeptidase family protein [Pseudomonadota bacterium]
MTLLIHNRFIAGMMVLALTACSPEGMPKHMTPVSKQTQALMEQKGMDLRAPILMRIYKADARLEVWKKTRNGRYDILKTYDICRWSGDLGPKTREGDRQAPEGFYTITPKMMNPNSSYYLSFDTGFPNAYDRAYGRSGSNLMVHGDCSSRGCYAMTNDSVVEIYALARDAFDGGQKGFQLQLLPFRMTADNLYKYRRNNNIAFWKNLKEGSDHFEVSGMEPSVAVCAHRYVFDQIPFDANARFEPTGACPPAAIPESMQNAVAARIAQEAPVLARLDDKDDKKESSLLGNLLGSGKPEETYDSREKIIGALPASSPEALSLLPGVESGASKELRRIANLSDLPPPPAKVTGPIAPYFVPKDTPVATKPEPKPDAVKPTKVAKAKAADTATFLRGSQN